LNVKIAEAEKWAAQDPHVSTRKELEEIIRQAKAGESAALAELDARFHGSLTFGTAGIRGLVGAGESRMNVAVVTRVTYGLLQYLLQNIPEAKSRGIVIGRDARHGSEIFLETTARVARAFGFKTMVLEKPAPTPLTAYAVTATKAAAGVMVTASHNPPKYNGYKVYWENGAQIIPPHDKGIAAQIDAAPPVNEIELGDDHFELIDHLADEYVKKVLELSPLSTPKKNLRIVYSAMHGVGTELVSRVLKDAGYSSLSLVDEQCTPDPDFPTVEFPNPEEDGALDLAMKVAEEVQADIILANDPDADRLAAVIFDSDRNAVALSGNEMGLIMGHHLLTTRSGGGQDRLVMTTVVSSTQLGYIAKRLGVQYKETLTGFKWIANNALEAEKTGSKFVFGFEEAIGFSVGPLVRDKDGVSAALIFSEIAAMCKAENKTVLDRLSEIRREFGYFMTRQFSATLTGQEGAEKIASIMTALRDEGLDELAGHRVTSTWDLVAQTKTKKGEESVSMSDTPVTNALIYEFDGGRAAIRPSGTEPKIKLYLEVNLEIGDDSTEQEVKETGDKILESLVQDFRTRVGL